MTRCPITAAPATLLHRISPKLLCDLWRLGARVDPTPLTRDAPPIGLWRSPCDLLFFHPAPAGDAAFYARLYGRFDAQETPARALTRQDMRAVADRIGAGQRVLDVGAGAGAFRALIPHARYRGLEPHAPAADPDLLPETVEVHATRAPAAYDAVCAFQVLEHAADPLGMARAMRACVRPGGLLAWSVPLWPSPPTAVANNLVNLPPHHLTLWSARAGRALCDAIDVHPVAIGPVPASPTHAVALWAARLLPRDPGPPVAVRAGWAGHARFALAYAAARGLAATLGLPPHPAPIDLLILAHRPA